METDITTPTPSPEKRYQCRIEELPTVSGFLIESLERDMTDFTAHSPVYSVTYLNDFRSKRTEIINLIAPRVVTDQKKVVTEDLYDMLSAMRQPLNKLENYVMLASRHRVAPSSPAPAADAPRAVASGGSRLTVAPEDFGISRVREKIAGSDVEAFDGAMKILKKHITDNYSALVNVGYTDAQRDELYAIWSKVNTDNANQNLKDDERDNLAEKNIIQYNELWDMMVEICETGKALYKVPQPAKADEYTMDKLKNRVRQEEPAARFRVITLDKDETRMLHNIIPGSEISNTDKTVIAFWAGNGSMPADAVEIESKKTVTLPSSMGSTISFKNLSSTAKGKIKVLAIGSVDE